MPMAWLIAVAIGIGLIIFRRPFARYVVESQNRVWGFSFGVSATWSAGVVATLVGIGFVALGVLAALGIIRPK